MMNISGRIRAFIPFECSLFRTKTRGGKAILCEPQKNSCHPQFLFIRGYMEDQNPRQDHSCQSTDKTSSYLRSKDQRVMMISYCDVLKHPASIPQQRSTLHL